MAVESSRGIDAPLQIPISGKGESILSVTHAAIQQPNSSLISAHGARSARKSIHQLFCNAAYTMLVYYCPHSTKAGSQSFLEHPGHFLLEPCDVRDELLVRQGRVVHCLSQLRLELSSIRRRQERDTASMSKPDLPCSQAQSTEKELYPEQSLAPNRDLVALAIFVLACLELGELV